MGKRVFDRVLQLELLAQLGHVGCETVPFPHQVRKGERCRFFAMGHEDRRTAPERRNPCQQFLLVAMSREPADGPNPGPHRNLLAPNRDPLCMVYYPPAQRSLRLEPDEDDAALRPPQVVLQMMPDTPPFAHAAARDDDGP